MLKYEILKKIRKKSEKLKLYKEYYKSSFLFSKEREHEKQQIRMIKKNLKRLCSLYKGR